MISSRANLIVHCKCCLIDLHTNGANAVRTGLNPSEPMCLGGVEPRWGHVRGAFSSLFLPWELTFPPHAAVEMR